MLTAIAIGSGWGRHAAEAFAADDRVRLAGIVGRGSARTVQLADALGVAHHADLLDAIEHIRPDIASVAVHERRNPQIVSALLGSGCHVLCSHPVAPDAAAVQTLHDLAVRRARVVATDYTLRLTPAFVAGYSALDDLGAPLRVTIRTPASIMVIAVDLAVALAGPVECVIASARYPAALDERRRRSPAAFPPSGLLEHVSGCVTSIVPVSHAEPSEAFGLTVATQEARVDLALPGGPAERIRSLGRSGAEREVLSPAGPMRPASEQFGVAMQRLVARFVDSVIDGARIHAPFAEEAHVRAIWTALQSASRSGAPTPVPWTRTHASTDAQ